MDLRYLASFFLLYFLPFSILLQHERFEWLLIEGRNLRGVAGGNGGRDIVQKKKRAEEPTRSPPGVDKNASTGRGFIKYFTEERQVTGEITFAFEHVQTI